MSSVGGASRYSAAQRSAFGARMAAARSAKQARSVGTVRPAAKRYAGVGAKSRVARSQASLFRYNPRGAGYGTKSVIPRTLSAMYTHPRLHKPESVHDARPHRQLCLCPMVSLGNYTPLHLKARVNEELKADGSAGDGKLIILNFSTCGTACMRLSPDIDATGKATQDEEMTALPFSEIMTDRPEQIRGSRKTLSITLTTNNQNAGGIVYCCMTANPVSLVADNADTSKLKKDSVDALIDLAMNSSNSRQYSAVDFQNTLSFSLGFASAIRGSEWQSFNPQTDANGAGAQFIFDSRLGAMSSLVLWWPKNDIHQTMSIAVTEQLAARYSGSHLLNSITQSRASRTSQSGNDAMADSVRSVVGSDIAISEAGLPYTAAASGTRAFG